METGIYCGDYFELMRDMKDGSIDLTIMPPPNGTEFRLIARELLRITANGGIVILVISDDAAIQADVSIRKVSILKEIGFDLLNTVSHTTSVTQHHLTYTEVSHSAFIFSKGEPRISRNKKLKQWKGDVETFDTPEDEDEVATECRVGLPEKLVEALILTWSNPYDLIFALECGTGNVCKVAKINNRRYLGIDTSEEHCSIARAILETRGPQQASLSLQED